MTTYSIKEKLAMAKIILDLIYIDGKIDSRETTYFEKIKADLELTPEDQFQIIGLNTLKCLCILKAMEYEQKETLAKMMRNVILIDEFIDPNEAQAFYDICDFIKVTGVGLSK